MANIFEFEGWRPVVHESAFVHPNATVVGDVIIGRDVYVGPSAVIRGDWGRIVVGDGANVQESCTIHMFPGVQVTLHEWAHIGHGAVIHGAIIGRNAMVGMNAVVMDNAVVGEESLVGALAFVPSGMEIPPRSIAVGNPARVVNEMSDDRIAWKSDGTRLYQSLPASLRASLKPCEPLREPEPDRRRYSGDYKPWGETGKSG